MTIFRESFYMDASTTTFGKQSRFSISRNFAIFLVLLFIGCLITTGLLVYRFASCSQSSASCPARKTEVIPPCNPIPHLNEVSQVTEPSSSSTESIIETTTASVEPEGKPKDVRLPTSVIPHSYDLKLVPFIFEGNFTFHGQVAILVNVTEETNNITLHANEITLDEDTVTILKYVEDNLNDTTVAVKEITNDTTREFLIIHLVETLPANTQYEISMKYTGILNDGLQGFYRSSYKDGDETRWLAATQFQSTDARRAFPCFDEPALKARFTISLARPKHMSTVSNMPKKSTTNFFGNDDYVWDNYEESVPMSTYLLAFVVSDFMHIQNGTFSVYARKSAINQAKLALQIGPAVLKHYEDFFQIKYPLPKMDMVALPDFSAGAMENWGLITYRESVMLYQEGVSTRANYQDIAIVIAHELAHQWFGNLVTPTWWTDLWLNEGFASYLEYVGVDYVRPDFRMLDQFVIKTIQQVFSLDALKSSHQISIPVDNPDQINNIFDRISYDKGAAIIRMMNHFLTPTVFKNGLTNYLKSRMYDSAEQDDLWEHLTKEAVKQEVFNASMTVKEIMDTWTLQMGFPIVTATRNYDSNSMVITQERYSLESNKTETNASLWWVPVTWTDRSNRLEKEWLRHEEEITVEDIKTPEDDWILLNVNQTGYYRVNYDVRNWELLIEQLNRDHKKIDPKNRAQLVDDAMNLALAGYLEYDIALNLTKYLVNDRDYIPWSAALKVLAFLYDNFERTAHFDKFKVYMLNLTNNLYKYIGFRNVESDPQLKVYTRMELLGRSCRLGNPDCIRNAVTQFQDWRTSPSPDLHNPISPDIKGVVYCFAIKAGGQEEWDFAWQRYLKTNVGSDKEIIMTALGCSRETWILSRYLEWAITENSGIRKQDASRVFAAVSNNVIGYDLTYKFVKNNLIRIKNYMNSNVMSLKAIISHCTSNFNTREEIEDLKQFAESNKDELGVATITIQQSIEQGEANVKWMNKNFQQIVNWLSKVTL